MKEYFTITLKLAYREQKLTDYFIAILMIIVLFYSLPPSIINSLKKRMDTFFFILIILLQLDLLLNLLSYFHQEEIFHCIQPCNFKKLLFSRELFWFLTAPLPLSIVFHFINPFKGEEILKYLLLLPVIYTLGVFYSTIILHWNSRKLKPISFIFLILIIKKVFLSMENIMLSILCGSIFLTLNIWIISIAEKLFHLNSFENSMNFLKDSI